MYVGRYVCMYVCMYLCMYVCMYVFMYVCMYVCIYVCMYVCMYTYIYIWWLIHIFEGMNQNDQLLLGFTRLGPFLSRRRPLFILVATARQRRFPSAGHLRIFSVFSPDRFPRWITHNVPKDGYCCNWCAIHATIDPKTFTVLWLGLRISSIFRLALTIGYHVLRSNAHLRASSPNASQPLRAPQRTENVPCQVCVYVRAMQPSNSICLHLSIMVLIQRDDRCTMIHHSIHRSIYTMIDVSVSILYLSMSKKLYPSKMIMKYFYLSILCPQHLIESHHDWLHPSFYAKERVCPKLYLLQNSIHMPISKKLCFTNLHQRNWFFVICMDMWMCMYIYICTYVCVCVCCAIV